MNSHKYIVEDVFGDVISKDPISTEQITKLCNFFSKNDVNINININFNFFKPTQKTTIEYQPSAPRFYE